MRIKIVGSEKDTSVTINDTNLALIRNVNDEYWGGQDGALIKITKEQYLTLQKLNNVVVDLEGNIKY
jgi:hypothetical protein